MWTMTGDSVSSSAYLPLCPTQLDTPSHFAHSRNPTASPWSFLQMGAVAATTAFAMWVLLPGSWAPNSHNTSLHSHLLQSQATTAPSWAAPTRSHHSALLHPKKIGISMHRFTWPAEQSAVGTLLSATHPASIHRDDRKSMMAHGVLLLMSSLLPTIAWLWSRSRTQRQKASLPPSDIVNFAPEPWLMTSNAGATEECTSSTTDISRKEGSNGAISPINDYLATELKVSVTSSLPDPELLEPAPQSDDFDGRSSLTKYLHQMAEESEAKGQPFAAKLLNRLANMFNKNHNNADTDNELFTELSKTLSVALPISALLFYAPAWANFFSEYAQLKAAASPEDLQAITQFWLLFATTHPIVRPVLWLAELAGKGPGPEFVGTPISSLILSTAMTVAVVKNPNVLRLAAGTSLALYLGAIGSGVAGTSNLGDYNLALNDGLRGCPTYEEVRQSSMQDFDITKYQGRWYEVAFHDYTQYSEVFATTFDINLTSDGLRWLDDFGIKAPSPSINPKTWDRSPVANGAHYFLYGKVDPKTPGLLQESGFGVVFPNYIVDVQKGPDGEYTEAIQFQCLERGGVRVFEGINFMTRDPFPGPERIAKMHERAKAAGLYPYGASPEQMHYMEHTPVDWQPVDNDTQRFWQWIGTDKLLALVESASHSFLEDSVRN